MSAQNPQSVNEDLLSGKQSITVLHVDDEPDFADLVSVYLERENSALEVITETSADAGLARLAETKVDCIVSDFDMPDTNGLEFLSVVREDYPDLPFILFTGKGSEDIASEAISAGVTDYLQKGSGTDQYTVLENRITNAVRQHRAEKEIDRGFQALETAREGISLLDEEGTFLYVNQAYADTYGYERTELIGEHWEILYPDDHVNQVYEEILPSIPEGGQWEGETVHLKRDGTRLIVDHAIAYTEENAMICLIRDITREKETQRVLEAERRRFELFVDAVEEYAIFALDPEGYVTSWNEGAERIKGYEAEEILGEHFSAFYPDEKVEAGYPDELLETALTEDWVTDRGWRVRKDGSEFWADVTITAIFDEHDQHCGFVKVTKDVSDRYSSRQEWETGREFTDQTLAVLDDMFYVLDAEGQIVEVTDRAEEITGYSKAELRSMDATALFPEEQRPKVEADIEDALATGRAELEADLRTKSGETIPYEFRKSRLTDEEGNVIGAAGIGRDISNRKRQERRLQRQLAQFERFGSVLSHDLRTPLRTIEGRIELARETGDLDHLEKAQAGVDRMEMLIDDLSTVMREGELVDEYEGVDIEASLRDVWDALPTDEESLRIRESAQIRADANAFMRLVENLLKNSLDHGGDTVTVGISSDGFYVEDDGPGIPADLRDEIFELGYSTKSDSEKTGFGLASARQIAVAHGWEISVTDSSSGGARFEIKDVEFVE